MSPEMCAFALEMLAEAAAMDGDTAIAAVALTAASHLRDYAELLDVPM